MKLNELAKVAVKKAMPITEEPIEVTFEGISYLVDENEEVTAYIVSKNINLTILDTDEEFHSLLLIREYLSTL